MRQCCLLGKWGSVCILHQCGGRKIRSRWTGSLDHNYKARIWAQCYNITWHMSIWTTNKVGWWWRICDFTTPLPQLSMVTMPFMSLYPIFAHTLLIYVIILSTTENPHNWAWREDNQAPDLGHCRARTFPHYYLILLQRRTRNHCCLWRDWQWILQ